MDESIGTAVARTYQVASHGVDVGGNLLPPPLQASDVGLGTHLSINTDVLGDSLHFIAEVGETFNHVIDSLLQD